MLYLLSKLLILTFLLVPLSSSAQMGTIFFSGGTPSAADYCTDSAIAGIPIQERMECGSSDWNNAASDTDNEVEVDGTVHLVNGDPDNNSTTVDLGGNENTHFENLEWIRFENDTTYYDPSYSSFIWRVDDITPDLDAFLIEVNDLGNVDLCELEWKQNGDLCVDGPGATEACWTEALANTTYYIKLIVNSDAGADSADCYLYVSTDNTAWGSIKAQFEDGDFSNASDYIDVGNQNNTNVNMYIKDIRFSDTEADLDYSNGY